MATTKTPKKRQSLPSTIEEVERAMDAASDELAKALGTEVYRLMTERDIGPPMVSDVFEELHDRFGDANAKLAVVVDNGGGDINAAFNLAGIFRRFGTEELIFVVPRWAKSADLGVEACGHYDGFPVRDARDGFDRLYGLWLEQRKRDLTEKAWQRLGDAPQPAPQGTASPRPTATSAEYLSQ